MENDYPKRKATHLNGFNYSLPGVYFVTVCTGERKQLLSDIELNSSSGNSVSDKFDIEAIPSAKSSVGDNISVGEGLAPPVITTRLTPIGRVAEEQLSLLTERYPSVTIEDYVIMPDHIHALIFLHEKTGGASPSPTLNDVICAFKSLTARICKQRFGIEKMFQRSYAEHIVRDREDYEIRKKYINENPLRWYCKYLNN